MDIKTYTNEKYIPLSSLGSLSKEYINEIKEYRQKFSQIIQVTDLLFVNIIETPELIKKRFIKNIYLKGKLDLDPPDGDYILEIAKNVITNKQTNMFDKETIKGLIKLFKENNNDLTIITNYITENIEEITTSPNEDIKRVMPELSKNEIKFIEKYNKETLNYTIEDFKELNQSSYETARRSLEKLKDLKLYEKKKIGKKFTYQSTNKLFVLMKGGE